MMISTRNLSLLPDVASLRLLLQSIAMAEAIICPEWDSRYYSFDSQWSPDEQMGSMRDGSGDGWFALFDSFGCFIKGFAHEAIMSPYMTDPPQVWPGITTNAPEEVLQKLSDPSFRMDEMTFLIWRGNDDTAWQCGLIQFPETRDPDGSEKLLSILDGRPESYQEWAESYYEQSIDLEAVGQIYEHQPLTETLVARLNDDVDLVDLADDINEINFLNQA